MRKEIESADWSGLDWNSSTIYRYVISSSNKGNYIEHGRENKITEGKSIENIHYYNIFNDNMGNSNYEALLQ